MLSVSSRFLESTVLSPRATQPVNMTADPQVALLRKIAEPESLHEALSRKYNFENTDPGKLFTVRLLICGKRNSESLGALLESVADVGAKKADETNPFVSRKGGGTLVRSVLIDYGDWFLQLLEGPERHVYGYMAELLAEKESVSNVIVLFFDDDVETALPSGWLSIDKLPPLCVGGNPEDRNDDEIGDSVLRDLDNLRELGAAAGETDKIRRALFADNAKINHPKLLPKSSALEMYAESELFLTLAEFVECFCAHPDACRESEVAHPAEDPLKY